MDNIETLQNFCRGLKGTQEDIKWGHDLCFTIGTKMYCVTGVDGPFGTSFKCSDEDYAALIERDGIIPAPYMARNKWVMVQKQSALSSEEWKSYITKSYQLISAKLTGKVKKELGLV